MPSRWLRSIIWVMARPLALIVIVAALIAGACSGGSSSSAPSRSATATSPSSMSASAVPSAAGGSPATLVVGGDRPVTVHVPASYDPSRPAPLLILLHGYTASGADMADYFHMPAAAERGGVVYAAPDGSKDVAGDRFWNATDACCNFHMSTVDDVAYLSGVIAEIQAKLAIDPKRIAVAGHSNGGFMSHRMACDRADLLSAIVSVAGETFIDPADCKPSQPVSVVQVQGTADDVILFDGGGPVSGDTKAYPGAEATAEAWAKNDGCDATPSALSGKLDVDVNLADGADPAESSIQEWSGCDAGAAVQLWTIPKAGHVPALTPAFVDAVLDFVVAHPKP